MLQSNSIVVIWAAQLFATCVLIIGIFGGSALIFGYVKRSPLAPLRYSVSFAISQGIMTLLHSYNILYLHSGLLSWLIVGLLGIYGFYVIFNIELSAEFTCNASWKNIRTWSLPLTCSILPMLVIFLGTIEFPSFNDAYRAHLPIAHDVASTSEIVDKSLLLYYGFSFATVVFNGIIPITPVIYTPQLIQFLSLVQVIWLMYEFSKNIIGDIRIAWIGSLIILGIPELVAISRIPAYDIQALFVQMLTLSTLYIVFHLKERNAFSVVVLGLFMAVAAVTKMYAPISIILAIVVLEMKALKNGRIYGGVIIAGMLALVLILPFINELYKIGDSFLFPYYGGISSICNINAIKISKDIGWYFSIPSLITFGTGAQEIIVGPVYVIILPVVLYLYKGIPKILRQIALYSTLYLAVWFALPVPWLNLRYFFLPFVLLSMPIGWVFLNAFGKSNRVVYVLLLVVLVVQYAPSQLYSLIRTGKAWSHASASVEDEAMRVAKLYYTHLYNLMQRLSADDIVIADSGEFYLLEYRLRTYRYGSYDERKVNSNEFPVVMAPDSTLFACRTLLQSRRNLRRYKMWKSEVLRKTVLYSDSVYGYKIYK